MYGNPNGSVLYRIVICVSGFGVGVGGWSTRVVVQSVTDSQIVPSYQFVGVGGCVLQTPDDGWMDTPSSGW